MDDADGERRWPWPKKVAQFLSACSGSQGVLPPWQRLLLRVPNSLCQNRLPSSLRYIWDPIDALQLNSRYPAAHSTQPLGQPVATTVLFHS